MGKRAKGEGSIFQRKDGKWCGKVPIGIDAVTGKTEIKYVYAKTETEVLGKVDALRMQKGRALDFERQKDTLTAFLTWWLENEVKPNKAGKTYEEYESATRLSIVPFLGPLKLNRITPIDATTWMTAMAKKKFSNHKRRRALRVLRAALNRAIKLKVIDSNPCNVLEMPKVPKRVVQPLEPNQCAALFEHSKSYRLGDAVTLAAMTGLRKGEILALEWSAVNIAEGVLVVRRTIEEVKGSFGVKEPKSDAGRRVVTLGKVATDALERRLKKAQAEGFAPDEVPLVFPNTVGRLHRPKDFDKRTWYEIRKAAGIPKSFKFHDLRHTQASLMIASGVPMKVVQERLGHSTFKLTADTYGHLLQDAQVEAVKKVEALIQ